MKRYDEVNYKHFELTRPVIKDTWCIQLMGAKARYPIMILKPLA